MHTSTDHTQVCADQAACSPGWTGPGNKLFKRAGLGFKHNYTQNAYIKQIITKIVIVTLL